MRTITVEKPSSRYGRNVSVIVAREPIGVGMTSGSGMPFSASYGSDDHLGAFGCLVSMLVDNPA